MSRTYAERASNVTEFIFWSLFVFVMAAKPEWVTGFLMALAHRLDAVLALSR